MESIFIGSILVLVYTYLGYGVVAKFMTLFVKKTPPLHPSEASLPSLAHIIAAYNEEGIINEKIENSCALSYPKDKLQTIIVTDGSTDDSVNIVQSDPRIIPYHLAHRSGKLAAINRVLKEVEAEIVVFSDANAMLNQEALINMVRHFQKQQIGAVAGEKKVRYKEKDDAISSNEGFYWKYESWLKKIDAQLHSVVGAAGELFAIRTCLYESPKPGLLIEDFIISMNVAKKGYRVAYAPDAVASESSSLSISEELKRKVRISAGGLQAVIYFRSLLNPFRYGILTFQYLSHRVLRWTLAPLCLVSSFVANVALLHTGKMAYEVTFYLQLVFYVLSLVGYFFQKKKIKIKLLFVPFYFSFMNISVFLGLIKLISGNYQVAWEKAMRK